jgi:tRNA(adenine34) deaminase
MNALDPAFSVDHERFMRHAIDLAKKAASMGEVPVGAVIVHNGQVIGEGWNLRERHKSALEHAEMMAITAASKTLGAWRLSQTQLFVTLEPCLMCAGAIYQARIPEVIYGALDPKAGACGSLYKVHEDTRLNHRFLVKSGLLAEECGELLKTFFRQRRRSSSTTANEDEES